MPSWARQIGFRWRSERFYVTSFATVFFLCRKRFGRTRTHLGLTLGENFDLLSVEAGTDLVRNIRCEAIARYQEALVACETGVIRIQKRRYLYWLTPLARKPPSTTRV